MGEVRHDNCALEPIALHRRDKLPSVGRMRSAKVDCEAFAALNAFEPEKRLVNEDIDRVRGQRRQTFGRRLRQARN